MAILRFRCSSLNQTALDWTGNSERIQRELESASKDKVDVICFPELAISGYGCEDAFYYENTSDLSLEVLREVASSTAQTDLLSFVGLPLQYKQRLYNAVAVIHSGAVKGFVLKRHLARDGVYYEPRWFTPWKGECEGTEKNLSIQLGDTVVPAGDIIISFKGALIGVEICEDAWVTPRRAHSLAACGASVIVNPSASHFALRKYVRRLSLEAEGAQLIDGLYAYCNMLGNDSGRLIFDGDASFAANVKDSGLCVARAERFSFQETSSATVDFEVTARAFRQHGGYECIDVIPSITELKSDDSLRSSELTPWRRFSDYSCDLQSEDNAFEEICACVTLGLFDYLRKSRSNGFVISLSGGVDSTVVAYLAAGALRRSFRTLGAERWNAKCNLSTLSAVTEESLIREGVICVYQATDQSSEETEAAAASVASGLGATFLSFDIQPLVDQYLKEVTEKASLHPTVNLPRSLNWADHDISLQNIQARVRGPSVWLVANLKGSLLLATSNRSEAAVGYTTMDGDTCGGLSPIAGLDKPFLRNFLKWLVEAGPKDYQPFSEGRAVTAMEPTAELRPTEFAQTDEKDLMPYDVLDFIERCFLLDRKRPREILELLPSKFPGISAERQRDYVARFFRLWSRNQWKRERYAPAFHLDESSLDPKSWCRFPILSGGFERELSK